MKLRSRARGFIITLLLLFLALGLFAAIGLGAYMLKLDAEVRAKFEGKRWAIPARVYARPLELYAGAPLTLKQVKQELQLLNYREQDVASPGTWQQNANEIKIHTRGFLFAEGAEKSQVLRLRFSANAITDVASTLRDSDGVVRLEPMVIGGIYPKQNEDRILIQLKDVSPHLIDALLATEDRAFYHHHGISLRGIARAIWVNATEGGLQQGEHLNATASKKLLFNQ